MYSVPGGIYSGLEVQRRPEAIAILLERTQLHDQNADRLRLFEDHRSDFAV